MEQPTIYRKSRVSELTFFKGVGGEKDSLQFNPNRESLECAFNEELIWEALSVFDNVSIENSGDSFEIAVLFKDRIVKVSVPCRFSCFHMMTILSMGLAGVEEYVRT